MSGEVQTKVQAGPVQSFTPAGTGLLQRKCTLCNTPGLAEDSELNEKGLSLQRSPVDQVETSVVPPIVHEVLSSPSQLLDPETRAFMKPRFGHDFSGVSILRDAPVMIQVKLTISQPNDQYEQEADRVADEVMRMPEPRMQRQVEGGEEKEEEGLVQNKTIAKQITLLKQVEDEEEGEEILQAKEASQTPEVTPDLQFRIQSIRGGSQPLPESVRMFFESRFGYDFSRIRIYNNQNSFEMARHIHAKAFAVGHDIFFKEGYYAPTSHEGRRLLAHELTHTIQQDSSISQSNFIQWFHRDGEHTQKAEGTLRSQGMHAKILAANQPKMIAREVDQDALCDIIEAYHFHDPVAGIGDAGRAYNNLNQISSLSDILDTLEELVGENRDVFIWVANNLHLATNREYAAVTVVRFADSDEWPDLHDLSAITILQKISSLPLSEQATLAEYIEIQQNGQLGPAVYLFPYSFYVEMQHRTMTQEAREMAEDRRQEIIEQRRLTGEENPQVSLPQVGVAAVATGEMQQHGLSGGETADWDNLNSSVQNQWRTHATEAIQLVQEEVRDEELESAIQQYNVVFSFTPRECLEINAFAMIDLITNSFKVSMNWVRAVLPEFQGNPRDVLSNLAHEIGHIEYGRTLSEQIMADVLSRLSPADRREIFGDLATDQEEYDRRRRQFFDAYEYSETEIFAELRERRYRTPQSHSDEPYSDILERLEIMVDVFDRRVLEAIIHVLYRRIMDSSEILPQDKEYFVNQVSTTCHINLPIPAPTATLVAPSE